MSRLRAGALIGESVAGILHRPGRTGLTVLGIVLGIGSFVAVLGITATATGQISRRFTELAATEVVVEDTTVTDPMAERTAFPPDADAARAGHPAESGTPGSSGPCRPAGSAP